MSPRCLIIPDGVESAARSIALSLRDAGIECETVSHRELEGARPAEAVLLQIADADPVSVIWDLHRRGYTTVVAMSELPSSQECIRLLNSGADFYIDAWASLDEVVARVRVALRRSIRMGSSIGHEIERETFPSSVAR
jgi:two-component system KDP operon response regulator KdpE